jgi:hypothetical protein
MTLTVGGLELRPASGRFRFSMVVGLDEPPEFEGENTVIVGKPGEIDEESVARRRVLKFDGWIHGQGATYADQLSDFRAAVAELWAAVAPQTVNGILDGPVPVVASGPYQGIPTGEDWTLDAKYSGAMWDGNRVVGSRHLIFTMICVDDPPEWQVT